MEAGRTLAAALRTTALASALLLTIAASSAARVAPGRTPFVDPTSSGVAPPDLLTRASGMGGGNARSPVLPLGIDVRDLMAPEASFAPATAGPFTRPAPTVAPRGTVPAGGRGVVFLLVDNENLVPGSGLNIQYETKVGTLQGSVDIYFAVRLPSGQLLYVTATGIGPASGPFRGNVTIADETTPLVTLRLPGDLPFGTYTFYMALVHAGADAADPASRASGVSEVEVSFAALSPAQEAILQSRGNPDFLVVFWFGDALQKRESWLYLSGSPTRFGFVNGVLDGEETVSDASGGPGPRLDPHLFTPQTTLTQLTGVLGAPATVTPVDGAPGYQQVSYPSGLTVILRNGRLSSAVTLSP